MAEAEIQNLPAPQGVLDRIPGVRQILLLLGVAVSVAVGVSVVFWSQGPNYTVLYPDLSMSDAAEIVQALDSNSIPYRVEAGGVVLVQDKKVQETRLMLAGMGLPQSSSMADRIFDESGGMGKSAEIEKKQLHRAQEQYLVKTIVGFKAVQNARIHLALPENSAFARRRKSGSASVFIELHPGRELSQSQVAAITHFVASSTPNLEVGQVTVVDQNGRLLTNTDVLNDTVMSETQFDAVREKERELTAKIENLLTPVLGRDRVHAEVVVEMDFTLTEETREVYDPTPVLRSEVIKEQKRVGQQDLEGVPGALSNQPPESAATDAPAPEVTKGEISSSRERVANNELTKSIVHVRQPVGTLKRLSVAVVLDNRAAEGARGSAESTPLSDGELEQLTALIKHAVGFDEARGDTLNLLNAPFAAIPDIGPPEEIPLWKQDWVVDLAKRGLGVILLLALVFAIVKPLMRNLTQASRSRAMLTGDGQMGLAPLAADQVHITGQTAGMLAGYENPLAAARSMAGQDPKRVAQVVKGWVANDG